uniref:Uncharacterized protein n=1 Tax=uncultured marine virus TaxID=186617 RepID=A0A0F7L4S3_9VIRU|nr:hypothetical protein [uncultured marine virus]
MVERLVFHRDGQTARESHRRSLTGIPEPPYPWRAPPLHLRISVHSAELPRHAGARS